MGLDGFLAGIHGVCVGFLYVLVGFGQGLHGPKQSIRSIAEVPDKRLYDMYLPCNRYVADSSHLKRHVSVANPYGDVEI